MGIWVVSTTNQLFIRGSQTETKFSKKKVVTGKTLFFVKKKTYQKHIKNVRSSQPAILAQFFPELELFYRYY